MGGEGSGHHGHSGRPGKVGGSYPKDYEWTLTIKGGPGSGFHGHAGRPGLVGGSGSGSISGGKLGTATEEKVRRGLEVVLTHGNITGQEISISLDIDGTEVARSGGERIVTGFTPSPIVIHNHPKNMSFSPEDMAEMFKHQDIQHQFLITPDRTVYRLSRTDRTPINEWPGRVEREYLTIDDRPEYNIRRFEQTYIEEIGRPTGLDPVIFEKHHRIMAEVARNMGLDYRRYNE